MRIYKPALLIALVATLAVSALTLSAQDITREEEIVQALGAALNAGDVDLAMTYIAANAYFGTYDVEAGEPYSGKEEIRALFEELVAGDFRIETNIVTTYGDGSVLISETQTWADWMIEMELAPFHATEVYIVKDDLIIGITWVMSQETQARVIAAMAPPPVAAGDIVGTWRWNHGDTGVEFYVDGTYRWSAMFFNLNESSPVDVGTYTVEDGVLTMTSGESINYYCNVGDAGIYTLSFRETGELELLLQSDKCDRRRAPSSRPQPFTRVEDEQ